VNLAGWLLRLAVRNADEREMILGDLAEEAAGHRRGWVPAQAAAIAAHAIVRRPLMPGRRRTRGDTLMKSWLKDVQYGWRSLRKRPLVTLTVASTLALGLGANAAIFNVIDCLVLRPFPFADPGRIVMLAESGPGLEFKKGSVSPGNFLDWRSQARSLKTLTATAWWDANLFEKSDPERVQGAFVSSGFFDVLGLRPALGRGFVRDDETFGRHRVVVIGDALWHRRFGGDPSVVGRSITIDGQPFEVIGIAPPRFQFPDGASLWAPLAFDPGILPRRNARYLTVVGHLAPGRTIAEAASEMDVLGARLAREYPDANRDHGVGVYTLSQGMLGEGTGSLLSMWQASALVVLLIACANIANLLLARAAERGRDVTVRLALGASRGRIVRERLTESVILACLAVGPAIGFAWAGLYLMRIAMPGNIIRFVPGWESLGPDFRLLGFTLVLALLTACVFGILPAFQAARSRVSESLKDGGRTATGRPRLRRAIVVIEMAIALPLLVTAGLGVAGTNRFLNGPQGYDPDGLLAMRLVLPERRYPDVAARRRFVERALREVAAVPGVLQAGIASDLPASGSSSSRAIQIDGHPAPDPRNLPSVVDLVVTPAYLDVMRIALHRGRGFTPSDREDAAPVAIVSESMARKYWPGENVVGRRVRFAGGAWMTIVGVSGDVIQDWLLRRNVPTLYRPIAQAPPDAFGLVARTTGDPAGVAGGIRAALLRVDPTQPVFDMMTMRRQLHERTIGLQYLASIMAIFAALGLILAAVGLYAVIAYSVVQRRHEIGLRMALGATAGDVVRLTVGQALKLTAVGTAIGLALSIALTRVMEAALFGIATADAAVFALFAAVLGAAALLASYLPARRAAAIDPTLALRAE
jgi:putative ABC transport system permease protein